MIWRRDNSSPSGKICSTEGRPIQERRRILRARFKEAAMRRRCPGSVPAEMFFHLAREVAGEGQTSRWFCLRHWVYLRALTLFPLHLSPLFLVVTRFLFRYVPCAGLSLRRLALLESVV